MKNKIIAFLVLMIGLHQIVYAQPKFKVTREVTNESAFCANDGKINIAITDAVLPVHFSWTGPDGFAETTQNISGLSPGEYNLHVEDGWCRSVSFPSYIIAADGECLLPEHITTKLEHASGNQSGAVALTITGNFADFSFTLFNPAGQEIYTTSANISSDHIIEIGALQPGEYCYVATNGCCKVEGCFTINCMLSYTQNMSVKQPENCGEATGSIKLLGSPILNGTPPYSFTYTDPMGFSYPLPSGPLAGLSNGEYCLIATDANGCQGRICVQIVAENEPVISSETTWILPDCSGGLPNGSITIAQEGEIQSSFNYLWDNGDYTEDDFVSTATNLSSGQHCVTITSIEGDCEVERCFNIPEVTPSVGLTLLNNPVTVINPCPGEKNGVVEIVVTGGLLPYTIDGSSYGFVETPPNSGIYKCFRDNFGEGSHSLMLSDYCLDEIVINFEMKAMELHVITEPGCRDEGKFNMMVEGGNPPYSFSWTRIPDDDNDITDSGNTVNPENLRSGKYECVVTDSRGCKVVEVIALQNKEYELEVVGSCAAMSSGELKFTVFNPTPPASIDIDVNSLSLVDLQSAQSPVFDVSYPGLPEEYPYYYTVVIDNCTYNETNLKIPKKPSELQFFKFVKSTNECQYKEFCNGFEIEGAIISHKALFDLNNTSNCEVPIKCGNKVVGTEEFDREWIRGAQYKEMVIAALSSPVLSGHASAAFGAMGGFHNCEHIFYCPVTLEVDFHLSGSCPLLSSITGCQPIPVGDGCFIQPCFWGDVPFCKGPIALLDNPFASQFPNFDGTPFEDDCEAVMYPLYQLWYWKDQILASNIFGAAFAESELYLNWVLPYGDEDEAKCLNIAFCKKPGTLLFEILNSPDINSIDLGTSQYVTPSIETPDGYIKATCYDKNNTNELNYYGNDIVNGNFTFVYSGFIYVFNPIFDGNFFTGGGVDTRGNAQSPDLNGSPSQLSADIGDITFYPNPVTNSFIIDFLGRNNLLATFEILDLNGRVISKEEHQIFEGRQNLEINLNPSSPSGVYLLKISNNLDQYKHIFKIIKI